MLLLSIASSNSQSNREDVFFIDAGCYHSLTVPVPAITENLNSAVQQVCG